MREVGKEGTHTWNYTTLMGEKTCMVDPIVGGDGDLRGILFSIKERIPKVREEEGEKRVKHLILKVERDGWERGSRNRGIKRIPPYGKDDSSSREGDKF
ncbi:unnamed protein product, partial [Dovyalis caffra]